MEKRFDVTVNSFENIYIRIETTNRCNYECSFCTHKKMNRKQGNMDTDLFCKITEEAIILGIKSMDIRNFGEPLLDFEIEKKVQYARQKGFENVGLTTNAELLSKDRYISLTNAGLTQMSISLSPEREFELTRHRSFDKIMNNLVNIQSCIANLPITIHIIATDLSTEKEVLRLGYFLTEMGYRWVRDYVHNWAEGKMEEHHEPCKRLWDSITVLWNGHVSLCCMDYDGKVILGDLKREQLSKIINSVKFRKIRYGHLTGDYPILCTTCNYLKK